MKVRLKKLQDQVLVLTGASSGIGLVTARLAAQRGAQTGQPATRDRQGSLYQPSHDLSERGDYPRHVFETSAYTQGRMHPVLSGAAVLGAGLVVGGLWSMLRGHDQG